MAGRRRDSLMTQPGRFQLNIDSSAEKRRFLQAVFLDFVGKVLPDQDRLVDILFQAQYLTEEETDLLHIDVTKTRKNQARKIWRHLYKMPLETFKVHVTPIICSFYPHIVPLEYRVSRGVDRDVDTRRPSLRAEGGDYYSDGDRNTDSNDNGLQRDGPGCLQHEIRSNIRMMDMVDIFMHLQLLKFEQYEEFDDAQDNPQLKDSLWDKLFLCCRDLPEDTVMMLRDSVLNLLRYKLVLPEDFSVFVSRGFPCTCLARDVPVSSASSPLVSDEDDESGHKRWLLHKVSSWCGAPSLSESMDRDRSYYSEDDYKCEKGRQSTHNESHDSWFSKWAEQANLAKDTTLKLFVSNMTKKEDLMLLVEGNNAQKFQEENQLPSDQYGLLIEAVARLSDDVTPSGFCGSVLDFLDQGECVRILLYGKTGSGKSTTGNTIVGESVFSTSGGFTSESRACERVSRERDGRTLEIMDCPGLYDTHRSKADIEAAIVQAVLGLHPGLHILLYVIRLGDRYTPEQFHIFQRLKAIFDDSITRHTIILFTRADELERDNMRVREIIESNSPPQLKQVMTECDNRYVVFNNRAIDSRPQLQQLARLIKETKSRNRGQHYACTKYEEMHRAIENEVDELCHRADRQHDDRDTGQLWDNFKQPVTASKQLPSTDSPLQTTTDKPRHTEFMVDGVREDMLQPGPSPQTHFQEFTRCESQPRLELQKKSINQKQKDQPNEMTTMVKEINTSTNSFNQNENVVSAQEALTFVKKQATQSRASRFFRRLLEILKNIFRMHSNIQETAYLWSQNPLEVEMKP